MNEPTPTDHGFPGGRFLNGAETLAQGDIYLRTAVRRHAYVPDAWLGKTVAHISACVESQKPKFIRPL